MSQCSCWNIRHKAACGKAARYRCTACGDTLCAYCSVNHHAHKTIEKIEAKV